MSRPKVVDAPAQINATKAVEYAKKIVNEYKSGSITTAALAHTMGHENDKSGTFLVKLADLKRYGILESKGDGLYATDLAKRLSAWTSEEEKENALREMVFNITIFKQLYDAFQSNRAPSESEILSQLLNITKKDRAELQSISGEIRKFYIDAMQYITMSTSQRTSTVSSQLQEGEKIGLEIATPFSDNKQDILTFTAEGISLKVINDNAHLEKAKAFLSLFTEEKGEGKKKKEN